MRLIITTLATTFALFAFTLPAHATESEIRAVAEQWAKGIGMGDPDYMVSLYADDAILHGTVSPVIRIGPAMIREYFAAIADNPPTQYFVEPMHIRLYGDIAVNTGNYAVRLAPDQEPIVLRYSFVYHQENGVWKIVDHHSSRLPE